MFFSKTFGYAVRGVLYIAAMQTEKRYMQVEEIAMHLHVPRYFMGKVLKRLAKEEIIDSVKGPFGGFAVNHRTLNVSLMELFTLTDGEIAFAHCVLQFKQCNPLEPCPLHQKISDYKNNLEAVLKATTISKLLKEDKHHLLKSISVS